MPVYIKQTWLNGPSGNTPLSAERLQHIEDGIVAVESALTGAVTQEQSRAVIAEQQTTASLNAEITRATSTESGLATSISSETTRAEAAEAVRVPTSRQVNGHALTADVSLTKGDVGLGAVDNTADLNKPVSTAQAAADALAVPLTQRGVANGVATLDGAGKIPTVQLPPLAINDTFTVTSQAAMLALTAQRGDAAVRTDLSPAETFLLTTDDPTQLVNWVQITTAGAVTSVFGRTGAVALAKADVTGTGLGAADVGAENVVVHGSTAGTARPAGATVVHWIGSVAPTNAATNDEWSDTTSKLLKRWNGTAFDVFGSGAYIPASFTVYAPTIAALNGLTLDPTGATDQTAIMDACYAAAKAALTAGAAPKIVWPAGTFYFNPAASRMVIPFDQALTGTVEIHGSSRAGTVFKLSPAAPGLVGLPATWNTAGVFQHLHLHDFTVDCNNVTFAQGGFYGIVLAFNGRGVNVDDFLVERVDTINVGVPLWGQTPRRNIDITLNGWAQGNTDIAQTITNVTIRDCHLGRSGGGGNSGILISGFYSTAHGGGTVSDGSIVRASNGGAKTNIWIDNIIIEKNTWRSGITSYAGHALASEGVGVMVGGDALVGLLRIRDNILIGSTDDLIEVNSVYDAIVEGNYVEDCFSEAIYVRPTYAGLPNPERQRIVVRNNYYRPNITAATLSAVTFPGGVLIHNKDFGVPAGNIVVENHTSISTVGLPAASGGVSGFGVRVIGAFNSVRINGVYGGITGWTFPSSGGSFRMVEVLCPVGRGSIDVTNVLPVVSVTHNGTGILALRGCSVAACADYRVKVDGVHPMWRNVIKGSTGAVQTSDLEMLDGNGSLTVDTFGGGTLLTTSYTADVGSLADLAVAGGVLTATANLSTEKRVAWYRNDTDFSFGQTGPHTDGYVTAKFTPPTTPAAGYRAGVRSKVSADGLSSVHSYVAYDGANYSMNIDTEIGGVLTNQATVVIGASLPANPFWIRGGIIGSTVTADILTAAPATRGTFPVASTSATYTLTGATLTAFGPAAPQGWAGFTWVPQDTGSTIDDLTRFHQGSMVFTATRIGAKEVLTTGVSARGVDLGSSFVTTTRVTKPFEFDDCDFTMYAQAGGVTEFNSFGAADRVQTRQRRIGWSTPPAPAAVSLSGSPALVTNTDGFENLYALYGGTSTVISKLTGGRRLVDVATTSGAATVTSATGNFTTADVGATFSAQGVPTGTTVLSVQSATAITLSANATVTASNVTAAVGATVSQVGTVTPYQDRLAPGEALQVTYSSGPTVRKVPTT